MIQLLFLVLFAEGAVALLLIVKVGPLRELVMRGVDQVKTSKGPATVRTLTCTLSVILMPNVASILKIQNMGLKLGTVNPMDQVLWRTQLLEASHCSAPTDMPTYCTKKNLLIQHKLQTRISAPQTTKKKATYLLTKTAQLILNSQHKRKHLLSKHALDTDPAPSSAKKANPDTHPSQ